MFKDLNVNNFEENVIKNKKVVLVEFYSKDYSPCNVLDIILKEILDYTEIIDIFKVDFDKEKELSKKYKVETVPTIIIFKNGIAIDTKSDNLDEDNIIDFVNNYLYDDV